MIGTAKCAISAPFYAAKTWLAKNSSNSFTSAFLYCAKYQSTYQYFIESSKLASETTFAVHSHKIHIGVKANRNFSKIS